MILAHKIALDPNNKQRTYFAQAAGVARFSYNWALGEWQRQYEARKLDPSLPQPSHYSLRKQLNAIKREQFPWIYNVTKCASQEAIIDLGSAFESFFKKRSKYPRFKKRGIADSFCADHDVRRLRTEKHKLKLPLIGWVRMREEVRFAGALKRVTVSRKADRWYASVMVEMPEPAKVEPAQGAVGVDLGLKVLATLSKGEPIPGPKAHKKLLGRLRRLNRAFSRKKRGSKNADKARKRLARLHARIAHIRNDAAHKLTTSLAKTYKRIGIEDLNVSGLAKNRKLARGIMDGAWFEIRKQLEYKSNLYGSVVVVADKWFPSSKTCSCCGAVKAVLELSERVFRCEACGFECNRDLNAAKNLEKMADSLAASVCGENRSGLARKSRVKRVSMKQKPDSDSDPCAA